MRRLLTFATILIFSFSLMAQIEGGRERYKFEPGDKVIYENDFSTCPVGEIVPEIKLAKGSYECAKFQNRIWIRPLSMDTVIYMPIKFPKEFSVEFTAVPFKEGCPVVFFRIHSVKQMSNIEKGELFSWGRGIIAKAELSCEKFVVGAKDIPGEDNLGDKTVRTVPMKTYKVAIQIRRNQIRFFLNGKRVFSKPFRPREPLGGLTFHFRRFYSVATPYEDAPVLITNLRISKYTKPEIPPKPEKDLIKELSAVETPEGLKIILQEAVLFDFNKWNLKPGAEEVLKKVAVLSKLKKDKKIKIEGHTDNVGPRNYNMVLSYLRAYVVALKLASFGVDPERMIIKGYGPLKPIADNSTEEGKAKNRRVEILIEK